MPLPSAILETCLDVADLARSIAFYNRVFGYPPMCSGERFCALQVGGSQILILFLRGHEPLGAVFPFGTIPSHESRGTSHLGFRIPAESLPAWQVHLIEQGIPIESQFTWPRGGSSLYFRDPDEHLLELLTPGVWPTY